MFTHRHAVQSLNTRGLINLISELKNKLPKAVRGHVPVSAYAYFQSLFEAQEQ
jgi:hypothetical protein